MSTSQEKRRAALAAAWDQIDQLKARLAASDLSPGRTVEVKLFDGDRVVDVQTVTVAADGSITLAAPPPAHVVRVEVTS